MAEKDLMKPLLKQSTRDVGWLIRVYSEEKENQKERENLELSISHLTATIMPIPSGAICKQKTTPEETTLYRTELWMDTAG